MLAPITSTSPGTSRLVIWLRLFAVVIGHAQVRPGLVAAALRLRAVADGVERVVKLLAGHRRAVREILAAVGHLPQRIVAVNPIAAVGQRVLRPLVGRVVVVIEGQRQNAGGTWRRRKSASAGSR